MIVKNVHLRNFRNYQDEIISFGDSLNIITGKNGQGKTNILESLVLLSTTRSFKDVDDSMMIKHKELFGDVCANFFDDRNKQLKVVLSNKGKTLLYNNQPITKTSDFIGLLNVIIFEPSNINFFDESPGYRRKVFDMEISKVSKKYVQALNEYYHLLKERNAYLKNELIDDNYLFVLNEKMIESQMIIISYRQEIVDIINQNISKIFSKLLNKQVNIRLVYHCCVDNSDIHMNLKKMYAQNKNRDIMFKVTNGGIHREDFGFFVNDYKLEDVASQGQKRLVMIALKLQLMNYIKIKTGKYAVLLLDDVLSELDYEKQGLLLSCIPDNIQTIITAVNINKHKIKRKCRVIEISNGKVKED